MDVKGQGGRKEEGNERGTKLPGHSAGRTERSEIKLGRSTDSHETASEPAEPTTRGLSVSLRRGFIRCQYQLSNEGARGVGIAVQISQVREPCLN